MRKSQHKLGPSPQDLYGLFLRRVTFLTRSANIRNIKGRDDSTKLPFTSIKIIYILLNYNNFFSVFLLIALIFILDFF